MSLRVQVLLKLMHYPQHDAFNWQHSNKPRVDYHTEFEAFANDANQETSGAFPKVDSFPYKSVHVLLLSWIEDDLDPPCTEEIQRLREVFEQRYQFNVDEWRIPSDATSHTLCGDRLREFVRDYDHRDGLLIIYYAGHGGLDEDRQCIWYW